MTWNEPTHGALTGLQERALDREVKRCLDQKGPSGQRSKASSTDRGKGQ